MGFNRHLGIEPAGADGCVLETRPEHEVVPGLIHFAVLTTLAEVAASRVCDASVVPAQISVNLMSAAKPGRLEARGRLLKRGKRLAIAEGEVRQGETVVAKATVTFVVT